MAKFDQRLHTLQQRIHRACLNSHRNPTSIMLLAVSKRHPAKAIETAYSKGLRHFGENYLQEAVDKIQQLSHLPIHWHFIGAIQSNKTRVISQYFDWVHTVANSKVAQRLNDQRPDHLPPLNVCIQINTSKEKTKSGIDFEQLAPLAQTIFQLPRLQLRGLMTIPAPSDNLQQQRQPFQQLYQYQQYCNQQNYPHSYPLDSLSMGMSNDLEAAIYEHTTILRIGTALFGKRAIKQDKEDI